MAVIHRNTPVVRRFCSFSGAAPPLRPVPMPLSSGLVRALETLTITSHSCLASMSASLVRTLETFDKTAVVALRTQNTGVAWSNANILLCIKVWITACIRAFGRRTGECRRQHMQDFINILITHFYTNLLTLCVHIFALSFSALCLLSTIYPHCFAFSPLLFIRLCRCFRFLLLFRFAENGSLAEGGAGLFL